MGATGSTECPLLRTKDTNEGRCLWLCALQSGAVQDNSWRVGRNLETPTGTYSLSKRKKDGGIGGWSSSILERQGVRLCSPRSREFPVIKTQLSTAYWTDSRNCSGRGRPRESYHCRQPSLSLWGTMKTHRRSTSDLPHPSQGRHVLGTATI